MTGALQAGCGKSVRVCARQDIGGFSNRVANQAVYAVPRTDNLPVVYPNPPTAPKRSTPSPRKRATR